MLRRAVSIAIFLREQINAAVSHGGKGFEVLWAIIFSNSGSTASIVIASTRRETTSLTTTTDDIDGFGLSSTQKLTPIAICWRPVSIAFAV